MAKGWRPNLDAVPVDEALTLVVAEKKGRRIEGYHVRLGTAVKNRLRETCRRTLELLKNAVPVDFGPDAHIDSGEYLAVPRDVVAGDARDVLAVVERAAGLETLDPHKIPKLWFYAAVVGDDPEGRFSFVRKTDPHLTAKPGWVLSTLGDTLTTVDKPVFVLEARFDVLVEPDGLAVLNETPFETLFRGAGEMAERTEVWVGAITEHLPIAGDGAEILIAACRRNSFLNRRLRSIFDSGHLAHVPLENLRTEARARGLDDGALFSSDGLIITEETDTSVLLKLLNEDLFAGGLTGTEFAADRKRTV